MRGAQRMALGTVESIPLILLKVTLKDLIPE